MDQINPSFLVPLPITNVSLAISSTAGVANANSPKEYSEKYRRIDLIPDLNLVRAKGGFF